MDLVTGARDLALAVSVGRFAVSVAASTLPPPRGLVFAVSGGVGDVLFDFKVLPLLNAVQSSVFNLLLLALSRFV